MNNIQKHIQDLKTGSNIVRVIFYGAAILIALYFVYLTQTTFKSFFGIGMMICLPIFFVGYLVAISLENKAMLLAATANVGTQNIPPPPQPATRLRVARQGVDLGEISWTEIMAKLRSGDLADSDHWLDTRTNQWQPFSTLKNHP
jgi:hypothetical protein